MPTYEERLVWGIGDGHGLRCHAPGPFTFGGLNRWENWMPLPRAALSAMSEDLRIAVWPGSGRNTQDIPCFIAREGRSYVLSVSSLMHAGPILANTLTAHSCSPIAVQPAIQPATQLTTQPEPTAVPASPGRTANGSSRRS